MTPNTNRVSTNAQTIEGHQTSQPNLADTKSTGTTKTKKSGMVYSTSNVERNCERLRMQDKNNDGKVTTMPPGKQVAPLGCTSITTKSRRKSSLLGRMSKLSLSSSTHELSSSCPGYYQSSFHRLPPSKSAMSISTLDESVRSCTDGYISNKSTSSKLKHSVSFADIIIREYERQVGDNPSVLSGVPLSIGWQYEEVGSLPLEDYEISRPERRKGKELLIPRTERERMLKEVGHSKLEIRRAIKEANIARNKRKGTLSTLQVAEMEEAIEGAKRKVKRFILRKDKKRENEKLWINARKKASAMMSQIEHEEENKEEGYLRRNRASPIVITEDGNFIPDSIHGNDWDIGFVDMDNTGGK